MVIDITADSSYERIPPDQLQPFQGDLKELLADEYNRLKASLLTEGFFEPVEYWADEQGQKWIIDGHQRLFVCQQEGWDLPEVPVRPLQADSAADAARKLLRINSQHAQITGQGLYEFMHTYDVAPDFLDSVNFNGLDLDKVKVEFWADPAGSNGTGDEDAIPDPPVEPISQRGDLWLLGDHRVLCGDSTDGDDVARVMRDQVADLVIADPPYGMGLDPDWSGAKSSLTFAAEKPLFGGNKYPPVVGDDAPFDAGACVLAGAKKQFWFGADYYAATLPDTEHTGAWLVWDKRLDEAGDRIFGSGFELIWTPQRYQRQLLRYKWAGVFGIEQEFDKRRQHPTQKPVALMERLLGMADTPGPILDPYAGVGPVVLAGEKQGLAVRALELSPPYVDVLVRRWQDYTSQAAILDGTDQTFSQVEADRATD